jgi:glycosyltransferase involved in cell wall biosynthesis
MSVSVVMPNYNNARFIEHCLKSLAGDPAISEIVIYDNASTDNSIAIIERFGDPRVRLIRGAENLGATLGRHAAVVHSTNDHICFVDGDDFLGPRAVSQAMVQMEREHLDISLFRMFNVDGNGQNADLFLMPPQSPIDGRTACELTLGSWQIHIWGIIRKSVYEEAFARFTPHGYSDDEYLTRLILLAALRVGGSNGDMYYRVIPKSPTTERVLGGLRTAIRVLRVATDAGLAGEHLRKQRNNTLRYLLGMARRAPSNATYRQQLARCLREYASIRAVPWKVKDLPLRLADKAIRLVARSLRWEASAADPSHI